MARKPRKGLDKSGKPGFRNIIPGQDAKTHSDSAKGMKQPQTVNVEALIRQAQVKGKQPEKNGKAVKGQFTDIEDVKREDKKKSRLPLFVQEQLQKLEEKRKERKIKTLEKISHPLSKKIDKQEERVDELKEQIAINEEEGREERLFNELRQEENQLRKLQEDITEVELADMSDNELKTLAIRSDDTGVLGGLFGGGANRYEQELVRRIMAEKELNKKIQDARKKPVEGDFLTDLF